MTSKKVTLFLMLLHMAVKCLGRQQYPYVGKYSGKNNAEFSHYALVDGTRYRFSAKPLMLDEAVQYCKEHNSTLVKISTPTEHDNVAYFTEFIRTKNVDMIEIWIGLKLDKYDDVASIPFPDISGLWSDQTEWHNLTDYSNFHDEEPKVEGSYFPVCTQLLYRDLVWKWDNAWCISYLSIESRKRFICENQGPNSAEIAILANSIITRYNKNVRTDATQIRKTALDMESILEASTENLVNSNQSLLNKTLSVVERSLGNYDHKKKKNLNEDLPRIKIEAAKIGKSDAETTRKIGDDLTTQARSSYAEVDTNLHKELFSGTNSADLLLTSIVYRRPEIFEGAEERGAHAEPSRVLTNVLSVDVQGIDVSNLSSPIRIVNSIPHYNTSISLSSSNTLFSGVPANVLQKPGQYWDDEERKFTVEEKCVFWDFSKSSWSTEGCEMLPDVANSSGRTFVCSCHHMTHFAVILSLNSEYLPAYLDVVTQVGCWISIFCVILTIAINIYIAELRTKLAHQILNNICIAILAINLIFVTGIDRDERKVRQCQIITVSLHYSVLLLWSWLLVKGIFLLRHLILAQHRISQLSANRFLRISATVSYIVPAIIVFPTAFSLEDYYSRKYCWITRDPMIYTILIPIGVVLAANIVIFSIAMYNITCGRKTFKKESSLQDFTIAMRRAMCMMFATGIPWIFGYMMLLAQDATSKEIFSFLFAIVNSLQGAIIFFLYCASNKNVQDLVRKKYQNISSHFGLSCLHRRQEQQLNSSKDDKQITEMKSQSAPPTSRPYRTTN